ncbi:MAG: hypothetical protein QOI86_1380 [Actinomycetota bacterium]|jgi:3-phenylpropionate/cinnamic acid dioxygenase small subunit|nr:hypothetical protein [Actinomycetota bacterium]
MTAIDNNRAGEPIGRQLRASAGDPAYLEIVEFYDDEVTYLDANDLESWVGLMAMDIVYRAPVRQTREIGSGPEFADGMFLFEEDFMSLLAKGMRLTKMSSAWAENPPSRTRRFVTNVRVHETDVEGEYYVTSSILLLRVRYDQRQPDFLSARRVDRLRRDGDSFKIARRTIEFDHATIGLQNLSVYF